ncbi:hypothetical protein ABGB07_34120 [Micromonosporaceae bacterium B7E4]
MSMTQVEIHEMIRAYNQLVQSEGELNRLLGMVRDGHLPAVQNAWDSSQGGVRFRSASGTYVTAHQELVNSVARLKTKLQDTMKTYQNTELMANDAISRIDGQINF